MYPANDRQGEIAAYVENLRRAVDSLSLPDVLRVARLLEDTYWSRGIVYTCGNGGSAATASHLAVDLSKGTRTPTAPPLRAVSLVDHVPALTAWANDVSYEVVFSSQLEALGTPDDLLIVISASGDSPNVLEALRCAKEIGMSTVGLLGATGGRAAALCDLWVAAPAPHIEEQEDIHMAVAHMLTRHMRGSIAVGDRAAAAVGAE
ncbi:SIS domain-containing protein [Streptomyces sp. NPDC059629]|uniref:D-sedoheptulose-7-phosphate isomerase n=1 Tax=Streptomyces sp. NPDC059629 TaxID=3346889 RepID=UPI00369C0B01